MERLGVGIEWNEGDGGDAGCVNREPSCRHDDQLALGDVGQCVVVKAAMEPWLQTAHGAV